MFVSAHKIQAIGPSSSETRLSRRALLYWRSLKGRSDTVRLDQFDPLYLQDRGSNGFLIDFIDPADPILRHLGSGLGEEAGLHADNIPLAQLPPGSLVSHVTNVARDALTTAGPVQEECEVDLGGTTLLYRCVLLPLCSSGDQFDHVYGIVTWKSLRTESAATVPLKAKAAP